MTSAGSSRDQDLSGLISHLTGLRGQQLSREITRAKGVFHRIRSIRPLRSELEARFWEQISICRQHEHYERAEHLQEVSDEALALVDTQPPSFSDTIHFLLELSPSPLEFQQVERRRPFEEIIQEVSMHDMMVLQQGVPGALGDSDSWSSADSIEGDCKQSVDSGLTEQDFLPPCQQHIVDVGRRDLVPFHTVRDARTRAAFQKLKGYPPETVGSKDDAGPVEKFHQKMAYLRKWLSMPMQGRSLTFQAFAEAISEEVNVINKDLTEVEKTPNLTMLRLVHLVQARIERPLKLCHICETITPQPEPWLEAVNVLSHLSNETFFLKTAKPMLRQICDLLVKGEFHDELLFDKSPQGDVIVRGPIPENMFLHSYLSRVKMSAQCAYHYKENTGKPLVDADADRETVDIIKRLDSLLKRNIPVQRAAKAAILPLCKLVNTALVDKLKTEYDTFRTLRRFQYHSFLASNEMHTFAETVFDNRCVREASALESCLEDIVGPEWRMKSVEPFILENLLPWPLTIFTCSGDDYMKVRTYIFRFKEAVYALVHMNPDELSRDERIMRFKITSVMDILNQHITLTAQECIAKSDLASGQDIEEISRKHTEWFEKTRERTLMHPKAVRNTLDDLAQASLRFARDRNMTVIEKKFVPYLVFLIKSINETLPVLAARLAAAKSHL